MRALFLGLLLAHIAEIMGSCEIFVVHPHSVDNSDSIFDSAAGPQFTSLQTAVNASSSGQTICFRASPEPYLDCGTIVDKTITIQAEKGAVVIDCRGKSRALIMKLSSGFVPPEVAVTLKHLVFTGGAAQIGGLIHATGVSLSIINCTLKSSSSACLVQQNDISGQFVTSNCNTNEDEGFSHQGGSSEIATEITPWTQTRVQPLFSSQVRVQSDHHKCLDIGGANFKAGAMVDLWDCLLEGKQGYSGQVWAYIEKSSQIQSVASPDFCLSLKGGQIIDGNTLQLQKCNLSPDQQWHLHYGAGGSMAIMYNKSRSSGHQKCIDVGDANYINGNPIDIWNCNGLPQQQWVAHAPPPKPVTPAPTPAPPDPSTPPSRAQITLPDVGGGGALYAEECQLSVTGSLFSRLHSSSYGGAILSVDGVSHAFSGNTFEHCEAPFVAGAVGIVYRKDSYRRQHNFHNNIFLFATGIDNKSTGIGAGAIGILYFADAKANQHAFSFNLFSNCKGGCNQMYAGGGGGGAGGFGILYLGMSVSTGEEALATSTISYNNHSIWSNSFISCRGGSFNSFGSGSNITLTDMSPALVPSPRYPLDQQHTRDLELLDVYREQPVGDVIVPERDAGDENGALLFVLVNMGQRFSPSNEGNPWDAYLFKYQVRRIREPFTGYASCDSSPSGDFVCKCRHERQRNDVACDLKTIGFVDLKPYYQSINGSKGLNTTGGNAGCNWYDLPCSIQPYSSDYNHGYNSYNQLIAGTTTINVRSTSVGN
jgi:hypothetical protein